MIIESITIFSMLLGGSLVMRSLGINGLVLPFLGFITGLSIFIITGALQIMLGLPFSWQLTVAITAVLPLAIWLRLHWKTRAYAINPIHTGVVVVTVLGLITLFRSFHLANWHVDSFFQIGAASLIHQGLFDQASFGTITKRLFGTPLMHISAFQHAEYYMRSITPLLSLSLLGSLWWMTMKTIRAHRPKIKNGAIRFAPILAILLLLSHNRFIFNTFYINGHLLFGFLLFMIAGLGWLAASKKVDEITVKFVVITQSILVPVMILTRAEGFIFAIIAVLPTLLNTNIKTTYRQLVTLSLSLSIVSWHSYVASIYVARGSSLPLSVYGPLLLGVALLVLIPLIKLDFCKVKDKVILWLTEASIWLLLLMLAINDSSLLRRSVVSTYENQVLGAGSWGLSIVLLALLTFAIILLVKAPNQAYARFVVTSFIPISFLLPYFTGGGYRVGHGDSLNRAFMHILPLAVFYCIIMIYSGSWRNYIKLTIGRPINNKGASSINK